LQKANVVLAFMAMAFQMTYGQEPEINIKKEAASDLY
jgi:hypothetical protein